MELALVMILCDNDFDKVDYFVIHARFIWFKLFYFKSLVASDMDKMTAWFVYFFRCYIYIYMPKINIFHVGEK